MTSRTKMKTIAIAMAALAALASPTPAHAWFGNKIGDAFRRLPHFPRLPGPCFPVVPIRPPLVLTSMAGFPAVGVVAADLTTRHQVPEERPAPGEQPAHEPTMAEVLGSLSDAELDSLDLAFSLESTFRSHGHPPNPNDKARAPFSNMGDDDLKAWMQAIGAEKSSRSATKAASSNAPSAAK